LIVLDTSGLLAWIDAAQRRHGEVKQVMESAEGPFLLSPFVLAELDYLLATRVGSEAQEALLEEVGRGTYRLEDFEAIDVREALKILRRYADLDIGLADASIVVLAERHTCDTVLTLDERHFRVLQVAGKPFRLLPSDA
jgi:predicted nucleic acid-binding protein